MRRTASDRGIDMGYGNPVFEFARDDPQVDDPVYKEIDVSRLRTGNDLPLENNTDYFALSDVLKTITKDLNSLTPRHERSGKE